VAIALVYAFLLGFMVSFWLLTDRLFEASPLVKMLGPPLAVAALPIFFHFGGHYIYDFPAMFFCVTGLYLIHAKNWKLFYLVLALGTINKETCALLVLAFLLYHYDRLGKNQLVAHLALQSTVVLAARSVVVLLSRPDGSVSPTNNYLRDYMAGNLAALWNSAATLTATDVAAVLLVALLVFRDFSSKPVLLRRASVLFAPLFAAYLYGSMWGEVRVFYDTYPVFLLLAYSTLATWVGAEMRAREDVAAIEVQRGQKVLLTLIGLTGLLLVYVTVVVLRTTFS